MDVSTIGLATPAGEDPRSACRCREGFEDRFGRWVPLRGVLAQQRLYNGGEGRTSVRQLVHRRWIVVEDRVQRIDR
jgi:hypothetical protein